MLAINPWSRTQRRQLINQACWALFWLNVGVLFYPFLAWAFIRLGDVLGL